jgi:hypothetical protein
MTFYGSLITSQLSSRSTAINAKLLSLLSDIDARRCVLMRRSAENDRSAVADAIGSASAKWKQEILSGNAAEKEDSLL